ncbi:catalase A [Dimargaris cristalligena]|nr:catalase A [Dimargaris cristalligena]
MAPLAPNSDDGSLGSFHVEHFALYPSSTSKNSSDLICLAEGPFPEFSMIHPGALSPPNLMSSDPADPGEDKGSNPSLRGQELVPKRAAQLEGENPDYATQDLFNVIADNDFPSWTACIRFMEPEQAKKFRYHIFDISKVWSQKDPENYFAEVEQTAYSPGNMVPGIVASFNRMPQDRLFSHSNTHRHHLDSNFN